MGPGEFFAPTAKYTTLRVLLSIVAARGYKIRGIDFKTAFLNATLEKVVYMRPPPGLDVGDGDTPMVCKLIKTLYGLRDSPKAMSAAWAKTFVRIGQFPYLQSMRS